MDIVYVGKLKFKVPFNNFYAHSRLTLSTFDFAYVCVYFDLSTKIVKMELEPQEWLHTFCNDVSHMQKSLIREEKTSEKV